MTARYEVAIVGGGPAGLSAAIWLARYLHKVVVVDSGDPRNWETRGINVARTRIEKTVAAIALPLERDRLRLALADDLQPD